MLPKVVITHWVHDEVLEKLSGQCQVVANQTRQTLPREEVIARCRDAEGLMVFMPDRVDSAFLQECPRLKVIGAALKGYDNLDAAACSRHKVWLAIVPDLLTAPTAELAVALLLGLIRKLRDGDAYVRAGSFRGWQPILYGTGLAGSRIGLLGMGAIGQAVVRRLAGFDAQLGYFDPARLSPDREHRLGLEYLKFEKLLATSDHLICCVPLSGSTRHLLGFETLQAIRPGCHLVNIGRGSVVDEEAVAAVLQSGHLAGYAADVFAFEDRSLTDHPEVIPPQLLALADRTFFTPHLGSAVDDARRKIALCAAEDILSGLAGDTPPGVVNLL